MTNEEGWVGSKSVPEWQYQPESRKPFVKETESNLMKYVYTGHEKGEICEGFHGKIFDLSKRSGRPIPPSEGLGYTNIHPNCQCYWEPVIKGAVVTAGEADEPTKEQKSHLAHVNRIVAQRARAGTLHTVKPDGTLSQRTRKTNPIHEARLIRETIAELQGSFNWMTPEYLSRIKSISPQVGGRFMLIRASAETITDHRSEGEPLRRLLAGDEIHAFGRTGIGKGSDINHLGPAFKTDGTVMDAEYDPIRKELQFLHHEKDPEIINAITRGDISEVSINAGTPRTMTVEVCDPVTGEKCVTPRGLILGELDNIAFTYVVSSPVGIMWRGHVIPKAKAGVRNTKIELI
jgi:hypothetical protein